MASSAMFHSYAQALGSSNCVQHELIQEATHRSGWVDKWPELLKTKPSCAGPVVNDYVIDMEMNIELPVEPIKIQREVPSKK